MNEGGRFGIYWWIPFNVILLILLFFVLKDLLVLFTYLHYGVSLILVFVGTQMVIKDFYEIPTTYSLLTVGFIFFLSMLLSAIPQKKEK